MPGVKWAAGKHFAPSEDGTFPASREQPFASRGTTLPALKRSGSSAGASSSSPLSRSTTLSAAGLDLSTPAKLQRSSHRNSSCPSFAMSPETAPLRRTCPTGFGRSATCGALVAASAHALEAKALVRNISTPLLAKHPEAAVMTHHAIEEQLGPNPHEALLSRLKSRVVRMEVDSQHAFLEAYRRPDGSNSTSDAKLNAVIARTSQRADELEETTNRLRTEDADLSWKAERVFAQSVRKTSEEELLHMAPVERQIVRVDEDKQEEELKRQRDDAQAAYMRVHRKLNAELSEMRDYRVYLQECRQLRLEKLQEALGATGDGRTLRGMVREMIRHGAQKVLHRLEQAASWLEPWMREVLANSCHLENRIEDAEHRLGLLRKRTLQPFESDLRSLSESSKKDRLAALTSPRAPPEKGSEGRGAAAEAPGEPSPSAGAHGSEWIAPRDRARKALRRSCELLTPTALRAVDENKLLSPSPTQGAEEAARPHNAQQQREEALQREARERVPRDIAEKIEAEKREMDALRRLLQDMRSNAAAAVCHRVRAADRSAGGACKPTREWGASTLAVLVSEDFARDTLKAMQKSSGGPKKLTA